MIQLSFDFSAPVPVPASTDLADILIDRGLAHNRAAMGSLGGYITVVPAPSRLYYFPIEYLAAHEAGDGHDHLYLRSPHLRHLPYVQSVLAAVGDRLECDGVDARGRDVGGSGSWYHAVDLMTDAHVDHLWQTRHLAGRQAMVSSISINLMVPGSGKRTSLSVGNARDMLRRLLPEPSDRSVNSILGGGIRTARNGKGGWIARLVDEDNAWLPIHGFEDGWLVRRGEHLLLTQRAVEARPEALS